MPQLGEMITGFIPSGDTIALLTMFLLFGFGAILIFGLIMFFIWRKKYWNLQVEIKLPRSDGKIVNGEWGAGHYNTKQGVVYIKRPGFLTPKVPLKIFDPRRYLQGSSLLTVVQLSPEDYRPVLPESFLEHVVEYQDDKTGEIHEVKESILNIKCETGHSKAWEVSFRAASKQAYNLKSFFKQYEMPITIGIVIVSVFVGIAALWSQIPK